MAAAVRRPAAVDDIRATHGSRVLPIELDVTNTGQVSAAVETAHRHFGRLDVVVNNAGYGHFGAFEELTEAELHEQLDVNLFGPLRVTQAVLPILRHQHSGHLIQVSSIGGVAAFPLLGAYHASKWALEAMSESLAYEVRDFGIRVTLVEPGAFDTDSEGSSARRSHPHPAYAALHAARNAPYGGETPDAPSEAAAALLRLVDSPDPPLRILLGEVASDMAFRTYAKRAATWRSWQQSDSATSEKFSAMPDSPRGDGRCAAT